LLIETQETRKKTTTSVRKHSHRATKLFGTVRKFCRVFINFWPTFSSSECNWWTSACATSLPTNESSHEYSVFTGIF